MRIRHARKGLVIDWTRVFIVAAILVVALAVNIVTNLRFPGLLGRVPVLGLSVWAVLLATAPLRRPDWSVMPETFKGTIFLLALVTAASMMPVEELPAASCIVSGCGSAGRAICRNFRQRRRYPR